MIFGGLLKSTGAGRVLQVVRERLRLSVLRSEGCWFGLSGSGLSH